MPFNISEFKSNLGKNGLLRASHYEVELFFPAILGNDRELVLKTESVNIPGFASFSADNYRPYGAGKTISIPYGYNPTSIQCAHMIDSNGDTLQKFYDWSDLIVGRSGNQAQYLVAYYEDYIGTMNIKIFNGAGDLSKTIVVKEVYPISYDQVGMGWNETDRFLSLNVDYNYSTYEYT